MGILGDAPSNEVLDFDYLESGHELHTVLISGNYTSTTNNVVMLCSTNAGAITITLPTESRSNKRMLSITNIGANTNLVTITGNGTATINGEVSQLVYDGESATVLGDGTNWYII